MNQINKHQQADPLWLTLSRAADSLERNPQRVESQAHEILGIVPAQPHTLLLLVGSLLAQGDLTRARALLESMAAEHPGLAAIHYELGLLLGDLGERDGAIRALSRVVALEPDHPTAWRTLGDRLAQAGDSDGARNAFGRQFRSAVADLKMLEDVSALGLDQIEVAGIILREFLNIYTTDVTALHMLGRVHMRVNQFGDAERLLARALELAPGFTAARRDYAATLHHQLKWEEESRQTDILLEHEPDNLGHRYHKATALYRTGRNRESLQFCEDLLRDDPNQPRFWMAYAYALRTAGRQEDCTAAFRNALRVEPDLGEAWWGLANLKTFRFATADIQHMRTQLARTDLTDEDRFHLNFALGKALEDIEAYGESFEQYVRGNALRRAANPYSPDDVTENVRRMKLQFTREFFAVRAGQGCADPAPIFIVGLPRSGSTLVEQILSSHSCVEGGGEMPALTGIAIRLESKRNARAGDAGASAPFDGENLRSLGEEYLERTRANRKLGRAFFTDKMLSNFHHLGLICAILPDAKIIDIRRHPLACCFSNFKQLFPSGLGPSYDLADIGLYYRDYVGLMAHFDEILPGRIQRVFYENLVADPEAETRRLLDHCGLPFEVACLRFWETDRGVFTASSEQVKRPVYGDAVAQWRHYDRWLDPLREALGSVLDHYPVKADSLQPIGARL